MPVLEDKEIERGYKIILMRKILLSLSEIIKTENSNPNADETVLALLTDSYTRIGNAKVIVETGYSPDLKA